jgi:tetratricopeptide (TPR) repeat protein
VRLAGRKIFWAASLSCLLFQAASAPGSEAQTAKRTISAKEEFTIGKLYFSTDDFPQAIEHFTTAIKGDPSNGEFYFERAHAYYRLDQYIQAVPDYTRSLQLKFNPSFNYERRAYCYLNSRQYLKGISDCTEAIKNDPRSRIAYFNRAKAYGLIGESEKSKKDKGTISQLDKNPRAKDFCDRCQAIHNSPERIRLCLAALKIDPQYSQAILLLGSTYLDVGQKKEAFACFDKLLSLDAGDLTAYIDRGLCRLQFGNFREGLKDLSLVLAHAPNCYEALCWRGECHLGLGDAKSALADFQKAITLMESNIGNVYANKSAAYRNKLGRFLVSTYESSAHCYEKEGNIPKAIEDMTYAIDHSRLAPNELADLLPERAQLFKKAGKIEEMHQDLLAAKAVSDKIEAIKRGPYIPPPPMHGDKAGGNAKTPAAPPKAQQPD